MQRKDFSYEYDTDVDFIGGSGIATASVLTVLIILSIRQHTCNNRLVSDEVSTTLICIFTLLIAKLSVRLATRGLVGHFCPSPYLHH